MSEGAAEVWAAHQAKKVKNKGVLAGKLKTVKRAFPQVPESEELEEDFSCAFVEEANVFPGRLYITTNYFLFYSPKIAQVCSIGEIAGLAKGDDSKLVVNMLNKSSWTLSSLASRDDAFALAKEIVNHFDSAKAPSLPASKLLETRSESVERKTKVLLPVSPAGEKLPLNLILAPRPADDFTTDNLNMTLLVERSFPVGPYGLFEHVFGSEASYSIVDHHTYVGETDAVISIWRPETDISTIRDFFFRTAIKVPLGPSTTRVNKITRARFLDARFAVVESIALTPDAPYGSTFVLYERVELEQVDSGPNADHDSCVMKLYFGQVFHSASWFQGMIEQESEAGCQRSSNRWARNAFDRLVENPALLEKLRSIDREQVQKKYCHPSAEKPVLPHLSPRVVHMRSKMVHKPRMSTVAGRVVGALRTYWKVIVFSLIMVVLLQYYDQGNELNLFWLVFLPVAVYLILSSSERNPLRREEEE